MRTMRTTLNPPTLAGPPMNPHQKPQEDVVVTQEDRDAADAVYEGLYAFFRNGGMTFTRSHATTPDSDSLVQAFARHRLLGYEAGRRDMREEAGKVCRARQAIYLTKRDEAFANDDNERYFRMEHSAEAMEIAADAIEALPTEPLGGEA